MKMPNMHPFEKKEKEVFFRLTIFFFQEQKNFSKKHLFFSFLCIVRQKKNFGVIRKFLKIFEIGTHRGGFQFIMILTP